MINSCFVTLSASLHLKNGPLNIRGFKWHLLNVYFYWHLPMKLNWAKPSACLVHFPCFAKLVYYLEQDLMHIDIVQYWASQLPKTSHFLIFLGFLKSFFHPIFGEWPGLQYTNSVNDRRYVFHFRPKPNIWPEKHLALGEAECTNICIQIM